MRENWERIFSWVGVSEGGYVNLPEDPGGATNHGVTQRVYNAWRRRKGLPQRSVRMIEPAEVSAIFKAQYWDKVHGDELPAGLDYTVFDFAVNSGVARASKYLQRRLHVAQDGVIGQVTLAAIEGRNEPIENLIKQLNWDRYNFVKRLKTFKRFGRGWTRRIMGNKIGAQRDDIGVIDRSVMLANATKPEVIPAPREAPGKAVGEERMSATLSDALRSPQALGTVGSVVGSMATMASGSGPIQWAIAAVLVLGAIAGIVWMMRRGRNV